MNIQFRFQDNINWNIIFLETSILLMAVQKESMAFRASLKDLDWEEEEAP